ncbi:MAG: flagellar biosynthesis protein FlhF [Nitrosospira sp.]|nr:flagellar biosynthesis protein FlhF [Nitrosospira sp.]
MSIKRFFAKTTSEALRKVRDALGPESVILSNRSVDGGIEILALDQDAMTALLPPHLPDAGVAPVRTQTPQRIDASGPGYQLHVPLSLNEDRVWTQSAEAASDAAGFSATDSLSPQGGKHDQRTNSPDSSNLAMFRAIAGHAAEFRETSNHVTMTPAGSGKRRPAADPNETAQPVEPDFSASVPGSGRKLRTPRPQTVKTGTKAPAKNHSAGIDARELASEVAASVLGEIKSMRGALEQQFASLNRNEQERREPVRGLVLRHLLRVGFSHVLAQELLDQLPNANGEKDTISQIKTVLAGRIEVMGNEQEILEKGGVYALVGPTGVGKTTTTAKLAARCVVRHGADKLALLTTDGYRIGGHEQLRIYGKILGVTVHAVRDRRDLTLALTELRGKHMVLIDTVGMGQRDRMMAEQVAMLAGCGTPVKRLLLLNAASNGLTLNEVAHAYRGDGLAGAIITKVDEAVVTGYALDTAIRHRLPLYYIAGGQRVPEDLELADSAYLANCALDNLAQDSPFDAPDETPLFLATRKSGHTGLEMNGAHLG